MAAFTHRSSKDSYADYHQLTFISVSRAVGHARYIGRVGALAVALGIGVAVATGGTGAAWAQPDSSADSQPSDAQSETSPDPATETDAPQDAAPQDDADGAGDAPDGTGDTDDTDVHEIADEGMEVDASAVDTSVNDTGQATDDPPAADASDDGDSQESAADAEGDEESAETVESDPVETPSPPGDSGSDTPTAAADDAIDDATEDEDRTVDTVTVSRSVVVRDSDHAGTDVEPTGPTMASLAAADVDEDVQPAPVDVLMSVPSTAIAVVSAVVGVLLSPFLAPGPAMPAQPPLLWALVGWVNREIQRSFFNSRPDAVTDEVTTAEDTETVIDVTGNDIDDDDLTVTDVSQPANGTVTINPDGTLTYKPNANFHGADTFTYRLSDEPESPWHIHGLFGALSALLGGNGGHTATGTVRITVEDVNDAPTAGDDTATTPEDTPVTVDVRANDSDVDGDTLTISVTEVPENGTAAVVDGKVVYTPDADYHGTDSFTYTVTDGLGGSDTATVNLTVTGVEDEPVGDADSYTTPEDTPLHVDAPGVLGNDADGDGDALSVTAFEAPEHGTLTLNPDGSFTYTPDADFHGDDAFTYTVSDGDGDTATATVNITVTPVNDRPFAIGDAWSFDEDNVVNVSAGNGVLVNDRDAEGDTLTAHLVDGPSDGDLTLNPDGSFTYTPEPNFVGTTTFRYRAFDGTAYSDVTTVRLIVNPVNDQPVAGDDSATVFEDNPVTIDVRANDSDVEGDALSVPQNVSDPENGTVAVTADGKITYTPDAGFDGIDSFTYTVNDGMGGIDSATVTVTVDPTPSAPIITFDDGASPSDVFVAGNNPDRIYVLTGEQLRIVDVSTGEVTGTIELGRAPANVAVSPDGRYVYFDTGSAGGATVPLEVIDTTTGIHSQLGQVRQASAIVLRDGTLYVMNYQDATVSVIDIATGTTATLVTDNQTDALGVSPDGTTVYVGNLGNGIRVIDVATGERVAIPTIANPAGTIADQSIAVSPLGDFVYVTDGVNDKVAILDTAGNTIAGYIDVGDAPQSAVVSPDGGRLYVANAGSDDVSIVDISTRTILTTVPVGAAPTKIDISADGKTLYVTTTEGISVIALDSASDEIAD